MQIRSRWLRILAWMGLSVAAVVLLLFGAVQAQQRLLRYRCERLLADFQAMRLHQSTWDDAQRMMTRWGAWGHYDGTCTAVDCGYKITLMDASEKLVRHLKSDYAFAMLGRFTWLYNRLGGRTAVMQVSFLVQDGTIWRSSVAMRLSVPPHTWREDDEYGYGLMFLANAHDSMHGNARGPRILGSDEQLAAHPNYKAGRPDGCMICMAVGVSFTPAISAAELKAISGYDLSCMTRFHPCLNLPDVLPAAREWHLYPSAEPPYQEIALTGITTTCVLPMMVRARDAEEVLVVDVLSSGTVPRPIAAGPEEGVMERDTVRVEEVLKSGVGHRVGEMMEVTPRTWDSARDPAKSAQHLKRGTRRILFFNRSPDGRRLELELCGVGVDSPEVRKGVDEGLRQNDVLRRKGEFRSSTW